MRFPWLVSVLLAPSIATADVWQDRVIPCDPDRAASLTTSSRLLYVNDCKPGGCQVTRSQQDSALNNTSSIASQNTTMSAYQHSDAHFDQVMECVRATMAPFDIQVTTDDPGPSVPHFEVMVAGTSQELNPNIDGAGGIAPFINCDANRNSVLSFVFSNMTSSITYLCTAIVHEAGHTYGLSHTLHAEDPMSYKDLGAYAKEWQNADQTCGIEDSSPQRCSCFNTTQNTFRALKDTFGLAQDLAPATLVLSRPKDGAYLLPGFPIAATYTSSLDTLDVGMRLDGGAKQTAANGVLAWNAPADIAPGPHSVVVSATDFGDRTVTATANVNVIAPCTAEGACADGFACLGNLCLPGAAIDGGLGASCTTNDECVTGSCSSDGTLSVCTGTCDAGNACPAGFACTSDVCFPVTDTGGCATAGGGPIGAFAWLAGLLALVVGRRRR